MVFWRKSCLNPEPQEEFALRIQEGGYLGDLKTKKGAQATGQLERGSPIKWQMEEPGYTPQASNYSGYYANE